MIIELNPDLSHKSNYPLLGPYPSLIYSNVIHMEEVSECLGTNSYTFFSITKASCSLKPSVRITLYSEGLKKGASAQTSCCKVKLSVVRQKINQKCIWDDGTLPGITPAGKKSTQRQKNTNGWRYLHCLRQGTLAKQKYASAKSRIYIQL